MIVRLIKPTLLFTIAACLLGMSFATQAAPSLKQLDSIAIKGEARWDYLYVDSAAKRLYLSHGTQTEVIDLTTHQVVGTIAHTLGVHGIAIAHDLGLGFTSDGKANAVSVFNLDTLQVVSTIKVGTNPDAIVYAPKSQKLVTFNGKSQDASIIDVKTQQVIATVPVGGKPEFAAVANNGEVFFNIEDTAELAVLNLNTNQLVRRHKLNDCDEPTGLDIDAKQRIYSVCQNQTMIISAPNGKQLAKVKIGNGPDGVVVMDNNAFSANGADGTVTIVINSKGHFKALATEPTQRGARTIAADASTHRLYLPTADFAPQQGQERPKGIVDTLRVLVFEAR